MSVWGFVALVDVVVPLRASVIFTDLVPHIVIINMHKKGSSHSNKLLIIEDPNAATARELRRMYSRL